MKKTLSIVVVLMLFLGILSACSGQNNTTASSKKASSKDASSKPVTITWAVFKDPTPAAQKIVDEFEKKNPNIKVNMQVLPAGSDAIHTSLVTALGAADDSIDVVSMDIIWPPEFGSANWVLPLNKYVSKDEFKDVLKGPVEGVTYKNNIYAIPWYADAELLFYRNDLVPTPPKTWDELLSQAQANQGKNGTQYGMEFTGKQFEGLITTYMGLLWGNGGDVLKGNKVIVNSKKSVETLQYLVDLARKYKLTPDGVTNHDTEDARRLFTEGKSVFLINWPYVWATTTAPDSQVAGKVGMAPFPKGPEGTAEAATLGGWNLGISKFSKHPDAAWKFIQFATSKEAQKINAIEAARVPTIKSLFTDKDVLQKNPNFTQLLPVFLAAKPRTVTPYYSAISQKMQIHIHNALLGTETPQAALDNAAKEIDQVVNK